MSVTTTVMIGCGGMAHYHLRDILKMRDSTKVEALVEPSKKMIKRTLDVFSKFDVPLSPVKCPQSTGYGSSFSRYALEN